MTYGICNLSIVPCRAEPSDTSGMVTQLLFGEYFEIIEENNGWAKITTSIDDYTCWIDSKQYLLLDKSQYRKFNNATRWFAESMCLATARESGSFHHITRGSLLPSYNEGGFVLNNEFYKVDGLVRPCPKGFDAEQLITDAQAWFNAPYLWGGRSPFGVDCSGFTQVVFRMNGVYLPRDSCQQVEEGYQVDILEDAQPADLAFFNKEGSDKITHVGILLGTQKIIHASGRVRIDIIDEKGIFNVGQQSYTHLLQTIRRVD